LSLNTGQVKKYSFFRLVIIYFGSLLGEFISEKTSACAIII